MRLTLTTVGTSLITNDASPDEAKVLRDCANKIEAELSPAENTLISARRERARAVLAGDDAAARGASAELNGLLSFYEGSRRAELARDHHVLVATDTTPGRATAALVEEWLRRAGAAVDVWVPRGFSTASAQAFSTGARELLFECHRTLPGFREAGYAITFNTTGGFKAQRDILTVVGMFYADEIVYIFERAGSPLLRIPRLPIRIDRERFADHAADFLLIAALCPVGTAMRPMPPWLPESLLDEPGPDGGRLLSAWGYLVWNQVKDGLLETAPVDLPSVRYDARYRRDFEALPRGGRRLRTLAQEVVAEISAALLASGGNVQSLQGRHGLNPERLAGEKGLMSFRVTNEGGAHRITARALDSGAGLELRRVAAHDEAYREP